jgi:glutamate-1-semialdehyde aminotransferase
VAGNMNLIAPQPEFLAAMRELCTQAWRGADLR